MMNNTFYAPNDYRVYLAHHGIKGQKWGVRRFQNADGSYTSSGKSRYGVSGSSRSSGGVGGALRSMGRKITGADLTEEQRDARNAKAAKIALAVTGTAAVAAGAYVAHKYLKGKMVDADKMVSAMTAADKQRAFDNMLSYEETARSSFKDAERFADMGLKEGAARSRENSERYMNLANEAKKRYDAAGARFDNYSANSNAQRRVRNALIREDVSNMRDRAAEELSRFGKPGVGRFAGRDEYSQQAMRDARKRSNAMKAYNNARNVLNSMPDKRTKTPEELLKEAAARQARKMRGH